MFNLCVDDLETDSWTIISWYYRLKYVITSGLLMSLVFLVTVCYFIRDCPIYNNISIIYSHFTCLYMYIALCYINGLLFRIRLVNAATQPD